MGDTESSINNATEEQVEDWPLFSCGTHTQHEELLATDNEYKNARANINAILEQDNLRTNRITGQIRIPVVVHVVWHTEDQKLSMEQVESQIEALNRDFNLENKDVQDVPSRWKDRVGNPNISFFLAKRDPKGNEHNGVIWVWTSVSRFGAKDNRMKLAENGSLGWDRDRFLNIWSCNLTDLFGFATFPGRGPKMDGVVIQWDCFGSLGKKLNPHCDLGRTCVHEVGHWLNLPHVFAKDQDVISDTPRVPVDDENNGKNYGKPFYPTISRMKSGATNQAGGGDMFMNYMDYCDDDTTIMFTKGQVARMRKTLATQRRSVFWSDFQPLKSQKTSFEPWQPPKITDTSYEPSDSTEVYTLLDWHNNRTMSMAAVKTDKNSPETVTIQITNEKADLTSEPTAIDTKVEDQTSKDNIFLLAKDGISSSPILVAVRRSGGSSGFVEVQMFKPGVDSNTDSEVMPTRLPAGTKLDPKKPDPKIWSFAFVRWDGTPSAGPGDMVAIKKQDTTNGKVEFHVLSSKSNYKTWLAHRYTALEEIEGEAHFMFSDWNGDGTLDLVVVQQKDDGSGWLVDILAGAASYRDFLVRTEIKSSILRTERDVFYDFAMVDMTGDARPDLVAIQKSGSTKVEVIVLAG